MRDIPLNTPGMAGLSGRPPGDAAVTWHIPAVLSGRRTRGKLVVIGQEFDLIAVRIFHERKHRRPTLHRPRFTDDIPA